MGFSEQLGFQSRPHVSVPNSPIVGQCAMFPLCVLPGASTLPSCILKSLNELDARDGMVTHLESDILECEVK